MIRRQAALGCVMLAWLALPSAAAAHDLGVARALLQETPGGHYVLAIEAPALAEMFAPPELPARCAPDDAQGTSSPDQAVLRYAFTCAQAPLTANDVLRLPWQRQGVMLTARWADGSSARQFFPRTTQTSRCLSTRCAPAPARSPMPLGATGLGVEHILLGVDHLLFVSGCC